MIMIYSSENISTCRISEILEPERIKMFSSLVEQVHTRSQLLKFFKDPSRSAAYFLGDMNAQLAMWSLTTLIWDPSNLHKNHVPSFELELSKPKSISYKEHCSICINHLSCASVFSPILINFPNPINPALGIGLHEDLAKPIVQFLLVCDQGSMAYIVL
jgi:hypothetical protein